MAQTPDGPPPPPPPPPRPLAAQTPPPAQTPPARSPPAQTPDGPPPPPAQTSPAQTPPLQTPPAGGRPGPLVPTEARDREPILDVLRGFALLGILLVNIELMRGSDVFDALVGVTVEAPGTTSDRVTSFVVGWLVSGKFVSAFSIMFGLGAALIARRALAAGHSPRGVLARRYGWLLAFGLAHMVLLFPGDVLFVYGVTGMVLLAFVREPPRTLLRWSAGLLVGSALLFALVGAVSGVPEATAAGSADPFLAAAAARRSEAVAAYAGGSYPQVVAANAFLALLLQSGQVVFLPWFLALFLLGFALGRSGLVHDLRGRRSMLRRTAIIGLAVGLPLNLVLGMLGPLGTGTAATPGWVPVAGALVQIVGAPLLSVGYLSALALLCLRWGAIRPLAAAGRMALSAYLLQSGLALAVFWGLGFYDRLSAAQALVVVAGIWLAVLVVSNIWMRAFRFGPAEWLWRSLTYGRLQRLRVRAGDRV